MLDVGKAAIKSFALLSPTACILSYLPYHLYVFSNPTSLGDILNSTEPHASFSIIASPVPTIISTIPVLLRCLSCRKWGISGQMFKP